MREANRKASGDLLSEMEILSEEEFTGDELLKDLPHGTTASLPPSSWKNYDRNSLLISRHKGSFLRPCPATPLYNCCGLNIFHFGQGCPISCSYCILSSYLGSEASILFGNIKDGLLALEDNLRLLSHDRETFKTLSPDPNPRSYRFCTGEFTDSLLFEPITSLSIKLVNLFRSYPPAILELKTKTANIDGLLDLDHGGRTVISFSLNSPEISQKEEARAASLKERLAAAAKVITRGYRVGFHFDPIIRYPGWEKGYGKTIELLFKIIDPQSIAWISLGCFRYLPPLKPIMIRKGASHLFREEFVKADDGKMRYPRPLRLLMYRTLLDFLSPKLSPKTIVYLCMESGRLWKDLFGFDPGTPGLTEMFQKES
jgi:spore photoproduct lyase